MNPPRNILFVDDETKILQGLKRMMRSMRKQWDMHFVTSGKEALEALDVCPVDVVVSDMRMPDMDGAQLLSEVQRRHPQVVRIVLSGHSDHELTMKAVSPAHQYLSKPCAADVLISTINRACELNNLLSRETLKKAISRMDSLPSLPTLYAKIMAEVQSADASIQGVGKIIARDVGMTTKVLQLVNSSFFGLVRHIADPVHAVNLLGLDTIKALVLTVEVFSTFKNDVLPLAFVERLWHHSLFCGELARRIASQENIPKNAVDDSYMAGLLHDVGKLVLATNLPGEYRQVLARMEEQEASSADAESGIFGATHAEVGAYLLGLWGLPEPIVEAVLYHHFPESFATDDFVPLSTVVAADRLAHNAPLQQDPQNTASQGDSDYFSRIGAAEKIGTWEQLRDQVTEKVN